MWRVTITDSNNEVLEILEMPDRPDPEELDKYAEEEHGDDVRDIIVEVEEVDGDT